MKAMGQVHYVIRQGRRIEVETLETKGATKRRPRKESHIGCPGYWLKRAIQVVKRKNSLAVAMWLHRRRAVCGTEWFTGCRREWCWNWVTRSPAFREYPVRPRGQSADRWAWWQASSNHQPCAC